MALVEQLGVGGWYVQLGMYRWYVQPSHMALVFAIMHLYNFYFIFIVSIHSFFCFFFFSNLVLHVR